jgi:CRISPR/Cas system-associated exonuclease Cas4 (RecB family)
MFTWSYSALKDYVNCPKQYQEVKVLKNYQKSMTQQILYGNQVHKALENYIKDGEPLAENYKRFEKLMDTLKDIPGEFHPELRMALNYEKKACKWSAEDCWARGIVDFLVVDGEDAFIVDYKTGSNKYPDVKQLKLMALMVFQHFPEVRNIKAGLMFVMHNSFITEEYVRDQITQLWDAFLPDLARLTHSYENNTWQANPTPLCGWCPVKSCEHHKER